MVYYFHLHIEESTFKFLPKPAVFRLLFLSWQKKYAYNIIFSRIQSETMFPRGPLKILTNLFFRFFLNRWMFSVPHDIRFSTRFQKITPGNLYGRMQDSKKVNKSKRNISRKFYLEVIFSHTVDGISKE